MTEIAEILPGVLHWSALHPRIHHTVHSYYVEDAAAVLDPMIPEGVIDTLVERRTPERVVLTNRHHYRHSDALVAELGCPILCPEAGPGALAFADAVIRWEGELSFVPDLLMGDDPEGVKEGIVESLGRLTELEFDAILLAHGEPVVGGAKQTLAGFVESPRSAGFAG